MSAEQFKQNPDRLLESPDRLGHLVRAAASRHQPASAGDATRQLALLQLSIERRGRTRRALLGVAVAAAAVALLYLPVRSWVVSRHPMPLESLATVSASSLISTVTAAAPPIVELAGQTVHQLGDGTTIRVANSGRVRVTRPTSRLTLVELSQGEVELEVTPRKPGERLELAAGRFRFRVMGTRFRVAQGKSGVALTVTEGRVAVVEGDEVRGIVEAGDSWSEPPLAPEPSVVPPTVPPAPPSRHEHVKREETTDCLTAARRGESVRALECFEQKAQGSGMTAEVALYEMARIQHDAMGNTRDALETLRTYMRRFPHGVFAIESRLKAVRLLVELKQDNLALNESQELLLSGAMRPREAELRFLRGKLFYRQGNYARAEDEFARAAVSNDASSDKARLERANCLVNLGRQSEARAIYVALAASNRTQVRSTARRRLAEISTNETSDHETQ